MPLQKRVLTLDGGGVRALSSLLILRKFLCLVNEELTGEAMPVPLKDVFDLVAGTSTGGLITLMLFKLDMSVDDCIKEYKTLSKSIFTRRTIWERLSGGISKRRYPGEDLSSQIENLIRQRGFRPDVKVVDNKHHIKTLTVVSRELECGWARKRKPDPVFLCTYDCGAKDQIFQENVTVKDAARATTTPPTYFPEVKLFDKIFVDGAYGDTSNPSEALYGHYRDWEKLVSARLHPVTMLNIGTGTSRQAQISSPPWWVRYLPDTILDFWRFARDIVSMAAECENVAGRMKEKTKDWPSTLQYTRFSEGVYLHKIHLDDYRAVDDGTIERRTEAYLKSDDVQKQLRETARKLALHSRAHRCAQRNGTLRPEVGKTTLVSIDENGNSPTDSTRPKVELQANGLRVGSKKEGGELKLELPAGLGLGGLEKMSNVEAEIKEAEPKTTEGEKPSRPQGTRRGPSANPAELFRSAAADLREATQKPRS